MLLVFLNVVFVFVILNCNAASVDEDIRNYFNHPDRRSLQSKWQKYKRGFETTLEQLLQENYDAQGVNVFKRRMSDFFKLTEGFATDGDPELTVVFRDLYLLELPKMRAPKVLITLGSNLLKLDGELLNVKVLAKYILYRNDSVIVYTTGQDNTASPFTMQEVQPTGEVTIIGEECRLTGHAVATLSDQSINLGHNTFSLTDCKFKVEIYTPGENRPPVFARYFSDCDRNFLQNLISKPLQDELMTKLQGGIFSYVNTSEIFGLDLPKYRLRQIQQFRRVNKYITSVITNMNARTAGETSGIKNIYTKVIGWSETINSETHSKSVAITNLTLYGLDTAYSAHTGGPIELNKQMYVEDTIGYNTLTVHGLLIYQNFDSPEAEPKQIISKFSAEIHDLTVVVRMKVGSKGLTASGASSVNKDQRSWYAPKIRNFELNLFEIHEIWARSLLTSYLTTEIYTAVIGSLLSEQLNRALKATAQGTVETVVDGVIVRKPETEEEKSKEDADTKIIDVSKEVDDNSDIGDPNVVLSIGKDKVRVQKGKDTLFEVNRASDNEINN